MIAEVAATMEGDYAILKGIETTEKQHRMQFHLLRANPSHERALRRAGRATAERYAWPHIIQRLLLPRLQHMAETWRSLKHST